MFWDASAIMAVILEEPRSETIISFFKKDMEGMAAWWGTKVECHSSISRLRRMEIISDDGKESAVEILSRIQMKLTEIFPSEEIRDEAIGLIHKHPLKTGDTLQLASALIWADHHPAGKQFVCLDDRLRKAAALEGFTLIPPKL